MSKEEALVLLKEWANRYERINAVYEQLEKVFGPSSENKLFETMYGLFDAYTLSVSKLLGDETEMLAWYCYNNEMGRNGLQACSSKGQRMKKIDTLEKLEQFIREYRG